MNRRSFFGKLAGAVAAFTILPSATTYERIWKPKLIEPVWLLNPMWPKAPYALTWEYLRIMQKEIERSFATTRIEPPMRFTFCQNKQEIDLIPK